MVRINLDNENIMDAREAAEIWNLSEGYVRKRVNQAPHKFPKGSIRKFGKQWVITTQGMEAITGRPDPRKPPRPKDKKDKK
ncbi:hypothetical protein FC52_GL000642 [Lactobacillus pasteurii DSM 23907 = CRBIP 24.76]|uniref:Helix-turn-helix domain-containing protein n=1 Tax=Lactobacillus pasteurii DSM 23907 = CRBIP 24.76 TaxID=1423790 RepID=I7LAX0_9LACO|nr:helix-turn-helix domain-containing protein [Lactobacillus pasteurii]KRK07471.1 hypothetical protein FC52_GL000642 [Lactobacillus pasteurii DSM 23907 = CRBIP 24.76]TDG76718.1 hypothetical protein C5L33_000279 [Lactobacillus pasteurii]CCI85046.1 Putative uncharacterized protein [Lactobacillus pasteurii DSM 23907 = CRBIP 24.76]